MLVHTEKIESGEDEIIIRYKVMTKKVEDIIEYVSTQVPPILGSIDKEQYILFHNDIYYFESVDNTVFAYTNELNQLLSEFKKSSN